MRVRVVAALGAVVLVAAGCSSSGPGKPSATPTASLPVSTSAVPAPAPTSAAPSTTAGPTPTSTHPTTAAPTRPRSTSEATAKRLPLSFSTGSAKQVITVVAGSTSTTTAILQAWTKTSGGWVKHGGSVEAHLGSDGLSAHPSESRSATPIGSFTLTQAFGHDADPGTALPYLHTSGADWWISEPGKLYNTHQRCSSGCSFTRGDPNEHLYYETPFYNYAVVIDYNTANAPGGVHAGAGSAFFLHVTDGNPTAGCVSIPQSNLVALLQWLAPSRHPRILIGVG
jgi:L,D-peptidoglycan transpeptidase YkuD (ErfK/YbiS/YcfS/YnhG family)